MSPAGVRSFEKLAAGTLIGVAAVLPRSPRGVVRPVPGKTVRVARPSPAGPARSGWQPGRGPAEVLRSPAKSCLGFSGGAWDGGRHGRTGTGAGASRTTRPGDGPPG